MICASRRYAPPLALALALLAALWAAPPAAAQTRVPETGAEITLSLAPVVRKAAPAVVNIYARRVVEQRVSPFSGDPFFRDFFGDLGRTEPRVQNSLGSGVILSADGIVVSNYHVVGQATDIRVVLNDRREFEAEVLLGDEEADLAVLRLRGARDLPALGLRASDTLEVGELVLAIGNPFGIGQTVSSGIVSALARSGLSAGAQRGYFIQTDAAINPGNSGGALVDMAGRLVGINTSILTRSGGSNGVGFAIPADLVANFVQQAQAGAARFMRPWAGVRAQPVSAGLADALGMARPVGVLLAHLHPQSPFAAAGLAVGDVVVEMDGAPVNTPQEMLFRLSANGVGGQIAVGYLAGGRTLRSAMVDLISPPETPPRAPRELGPESPFAGLRVINLNPAVEEEFGLGGLESGVVVAEPGRIGARLGLRRGDVLVEVDGAPVPGTEALAEALSADKRSWALTYLREGRRTVLRVRL